MNKFLTILFLTTSYLTFGQKENNIYNQDKETVIEYFRAETINGKLDFELNMKDDKAPFYRVGNILYNRKDFGILLWSQAIKRTEKFSIKEAIKLWEEIKQRKLSKPEKKAFKKGFKMELENPKMNKKADSEFDSDFINYIKAKWERQAYEKTDLPKFKKMNSFYKQLSKRNEGILADEFLKVPDSDFLFAHYLDTKLKWNSFNRGRDKLSVEEVISKTLQENPDKNEMLVFYYKTIFASILNNQRSIEPYEKNIDFKKLELNTQESSILFLCAMRHLGNQMSGYSTGNFPKNCFRADLFLTKMPTFNGKLYYEFDLPEFDDFPIKIDKRYPKVSFKQRFIPEFEKAKADYMKCLNNKN
ncbi:hypothetical protein [uncultured Dokdonia sp.]|uniref:hypothetical protein n=1 Tax=uncultured Dokdonia sp. TaxID=575653 RepID=UPI0026264337|nr:hypothetical protein [uncultured Dokdonia sp.]